ncbi:MAG: nuclear transport factor 2 family protein [Candidatus Binatia bacterium]
MGEEAAVLAANAAFYGAFAAKDAAAMEAVWARHAPVACIHPGWQALRGREAVLASWRNILSGPGAPPITCVGAGAHVLGDTAYVICIERLPSVELIATNVFVREDGAWRLVHHHAGGITAPTLEPDEEEDPGPDTVH